MKPPRPNMTLCEFFAEEERRKMARNWKRTAPDRLVSKDGRWMIRGPIYGMRLFWLYESGLGGRLTRRGPTFRTAAAAKRYAAGVTTQGVHMNVGEKAP
jgi:hypothetical protein